MDPLDFYTFHAPQNATYIIDENKNKNKNLAGLEGREEKIRFKLHTIGPNDAIRFQ